MHALPSEPFEFVLLRLDDIRQLGQHALPVGHHCLALLVRSGDLRAQGLLLDGEMLAGLGLLARQPVALFHQRGELILLRSDDPRGLGGGDLF